MKILIALGILLILAITYIFARSAKTMYKLEEKLRKNEKTMGVKK